MSAAFDPYHKWLGIPPDQQPPNHYRLLGLSTFEADGDVIQAAADRQMAFIRTFQNGPRLVDSQRILNELAQAKTILLDRIRKAAYDTVLRSAVPADRLEAEGAAGRATPAVQAAGKAAAPSPFLPPTPAAPATAAKGSRFGRYAVLETMSVTNLGIVYKVQDTESGRIYSLKSLPAAMARRAEVVKRFEREIEIMTKLDHPNLIGSIDKGSQDGIPFLVTEYVIGTDLATLVKAQGPLPIPHAIEYIVQAGKALAQLHANGVYHRNIKPPALLVDLQGHLKLTNLLMAKIAEGSALDKGEALTQFGEALGSVDYLSPEQALDASKSDGRSDIYSLGCTLHFLLTGKTPFVGRSLVEQLKARMQGPVPSLKAARSDVPDWLEGVFQKMLAQKPQDRYQTVAEAVQALQPAVDSVPPPLSGAGGGEGGVPLWLIAGGIAAVCGTGMLLMIAAIWFLFFRA